MVSDRFGTQIRDTVCFFAGFHHFVHHASDGTDMSGNLANQASGLFRHIVIFRISAESLFQFGDVVQ